MKTIVTGGAGFIGSHVSELLIAQGHEVLVVDNLTSGRLENVKSVASHPRFKFANADIRDLSSLQALFEGVDWVFHFAGLADIVPSIEMPSQYYSTNVSGTFNVLECAPGFPKKRLHANYCPAHPFGLRVISFTIIKT